MDVAALIQNFGFPVAIVIALASYIAYTLKINREDLNRREEAYREDSKEREAKLMQQLGELSATNRMFLETNAALAGEMNTKLDIIIKGQAELQALKIKKDQEGGL